MVEINPSLCTGCGLCAENCAVHAIVKNLGAHGLKFLIQHREADALAVGAGGGAAARVQQRFQLTASKYFGITEKRNLDGCLIVGHTDLKFRRTAPRNPARAVWR